MSMKAFGLAAAVFSGMTSLADRMTYELQTSNAAYDEVFVNGYHWSNLYGQRGANPSPIDVEGDYVAPKGNSGWMGIKASGSGFAGHSLTLGNAKNNGSVTLYLYGNGPHAFAGDGLKLLNALVNYNVYQDAAVMTMRSASIDGRVTVLSTTQGQSYVYPAYSDAVLSLGGGERGALIGSHDAVLEIRGFNGETSYRRFVVKAPNPSEYLGTIAVTSLVSTADENFSVGFRLDNGLMPGTLKLGASAVFTPESASSSCSVGTLEADDGAVLEFVVDLDQDRAALLTVTDAVVCRGKVRVFSNYVPAFATPTAHNVARSFKMLKAPRGTLDETAFEFIPMSSREPTYANGIVCPQRVSLKVATEDGFDVLYATVEPVVQYTGDGDGAVRGWSDASKITSSFLKSDCWSDEQVPHAGAHYYTTKSVLCPVSNTDWAFPGLSLIQRGYYSNVFHGKRTITFGTYEVMGGGGLDLGQSSDVRLACGKFRIHAKDPLMLYSYNGATLDIAGDIETPSAVNILLCPVTHTSAHIGYYALSGNNEKFTGSISFADIGAGDGEVAYDNWRGLRVLGGRNFGGRLDTFRYNALSIHQYNRLVATNSVTLAKDCNRGIYVHDRGATFQVAAGAVFDCDWPITLAAPIYKDGEGTLGLGGGFRHISGSSVVDGLPPETANATLTVNDGFVKANVHNVLDGMNLVFADGAGIAIDYAATDADVVRYGLYGVSVTLTTGAKLPVRVEGAPAKDKIAPSFRKGVLTVGKAVADIVGPKLEMTRNAGRRAFQLVREDVGDTVTFYAVPAPGGLGIIIR